MALLPVVGVATYNTLTLNCLHNSRVSATPVMDEARRTIVCWKHLLYIEAWIRKADYQGSASTVDDDIDTIKAKLCQPGGALTFTTKGYGNLTVNVSTAKDVMWGPVPSLFEVMPFGNQGAVVHFQLEWHSPVCNGATSYTGRLMAFNWDYQVSLDRQGISTRTISGYFEIPMTRISASSKLLPDMVDRYREEVAENFPIPLGFRREQNYHVSKDKRRCDFTITDAEIPSQNPLPEGVTEASIHNSLRTTAKGRTGMFMEWIWRMHGSITVAPQMPTAFAWLKFLIFLNDRLRWLKNHQALIPRTADQQALIVPTEFEWDDEVTGLTSTFSVAYYIMTGGVYGSAGVAAMLTASGLWKPLEDTSWPAWASANDKLLVSTPRGSASLLLNTGHDAIVDLCVGDAAPQGPGISRTPGRGYIPQLPVINLNPTGFWLWYQNELTIIGLPGKSYHWPLKPGQSAVEHIKYPGSRVTFQMEGWAWRFSVPTPVPELLTINGRRVKQVGETQTENKVVRYFGGWPIIQTWWRKYYILPDAVPGRADNEGGEGGEMDKIQKGVPGNPVMRQGTDDQVMKQRQIIDSPGFKPPDWKE